jgi:preprotein translocase subunit SecG
MELLASIINVVIIIASVLLVLLVLVQTSKSEMGLFQSTSQSVFGSRSGDVLTRTTSILAAIFLIGSFGLAYLKVKIHKRTMTPVTEQLQQGENSTSTVPSAGASSSTTTPAAVGQRGTVPSTATRPAPVNRSNVTVPARRPTTVPTTPPATGR